MEKQQQQESGISMSVPSSWEFWCYIVPSTIYITPTTQCCPLQAVQNNIIYVPCVFYARKMLEFKVHVLHRPCHKN